MELYDNAVKVTAKMINERISKLNAFDDRTAFSHFICHFLSRAKPPPDSNVLEEDACDGSLIEAISRALSSFHQTPSHCLMKLERINEFACT